MDSNIDNQIFDESIFDEENQINKIKIFFKNLLLEIKLENQAIKVFKQLFLDLNIIEKKRKIFKMKEKIFLRMI